MSLPRPRTNKSNLTRRRSLADSVHDLQHELEKELELRLGPDIDIGETPKNSTGVQTFRLISAKHLL